jgi:hypothetical protein
MALAVASPVEGKSAPGLSSRFWISFLTAVSPVLVILVVPRAVQRWQALAAVILLSPVVGYTSTRFFRGDVAKASIVDVTLAVWAVLAVCAPLIYVVGPAILLVIFGAAFWATQWSGRYRFATIVLLLTLGLLYATSMRLTGWWSG